jgi:hypothetical protein
MLGQAMGHGHGSCDNSHWSLSVFQGSEGRVTAKGKGKIKSGSHTL